MSGVYRGGYTGWVIQGLYRVPSQLLKEVPDQRSGPRKSLQGAGVGGSGAGIPQGTAAGRAGYPPLRGPVGPMLGPPWYPPLADAASQPIRARISRILLKVSQNHGVSPLFHEKACHSPCSQNGSQKSPLDFLRFLKSLAFSHKELMGLF